MAEDDTSSFHRRSLWNSMQIFLSIRTSQQPREKPDRGVASLRHLDMAATYLRREGRRETIPCLNWSLTAFKPTTGPTTLQRKSPIIEPPTRDLGLQCRVRVFLDNRDRPCQIANEQIGDRDKKILGLRNRQGTTYETLVEVCLHR